MEIKDDKIEEILVQCEAEYCSQQIDASCLSKALCVCEYYTLFI